MEMDYENVEGSYVADNSPRTVQDFVEDMVSDGRTRTQVVVVALSTRWHTQMSAVKTALDELYRRFPKKTKKIEKNLLHECT